MSIKSYLKIFTISLFSVIQLRANENFPCDLNSFAKPLPKLIFLGEVHGSKKAEEMQNEAIRLVKAKKALYGIEGDYNDETSYSKKAKERLNEEYLPGVVGIDDPIAHSIAILLKAWNDPTQHKNALYGVFEAAHNHSLLKEIWIQTKSQLKSEKERNIGNLIDVLISTDGNISPSFFEDKATMKLIIEKWAQNLAKHANNPENQKKYLPPPDLAKLINDYFHGPIDNSVLFKGIWRDILMTRNIAKLYCDAASKGIELRISIGNNHVPGIKQLLKNLANEVKLPIEDRSNNKDEDFLPERNLKLYWYHFAN